MSESSSVPTEREQLLNRLATLAYRRGDFTLASGRKSEHYVNCKPVSLSGSGLALISRAMLTHVEADARAVAGLTLGCLLYTSPSPRDFEASRMPSSA